MDLLFLTLVTPFVGALFVYLFKDETSGAIAAIFAFTTMCFSLLNILIEPLYFQKTIYDLISFSWLNSDFFFSLQNDALTSIMLILITVIGFFVILYSYGYMSPKNVDHPFHEPYGSYYFLVLLFIGAMVGIVSSTNFLQVFFFWEITTLCSWALISYTKDQTATFSGLKAFIMTHIGGICFIVALAILYTQSKSFDFSAISSLPHSSKFIVFALLFFAASAKSAQFPLFTWLPDAMVAPTPVSAYLHAAAMVKAGVYLVARIYLSNPDLSSDCAYIVALVSVLTMIISVILYYFQYDLKKILAYSTIGHLGYILLGVAFGIFGSKTGAMGGIFHIINHGFAKGLLFLSVGAIAYATGSKSIQELGGLSSKFPLLSACFLVGMFSIVGVPPFSGFWSKFMIFTGAFENSNTVVFGLVAILESILAFCWYIFVGHKVFFGAPTQRVVLAKNKIPISIKLSLIFLLILSLIAPLIGYPFVKALFGGF